MIKTYANKETAAVGAGKKPKAISAELAKIAQRKLAILNRVETLDELRIPPGNRLEALSGDRQGQYSIRLNDQWRLCFVWREGDAWEVEIVDYHR
ncbi:type II toxin-antitoxin system RelE/ParE family toxin [Allochromatium palmeri]|uniref:Type II toxin-antitoxin system RelE/ParE family toxin n=1 Tax=Allochromatium palmeri TaxID=231048 RepID=A0A6N8EDT2_9GAMM|nr:type II toxin-antitoxin system RelE/ParE family toxin [Allochromatium palmeri]MTW22412.1 type II toxin-antitoxin system RelE/ParE family toxin [Allochromatium palmeri]